MDHRQRRGNLSQAWLDAGGCTGRLSTGSAGLNTADDSFGPPEVACEQPQNCVHDLFCIACSRKVSERGMRVSPLGSADIFFSTDRRPYGITPLGSAGRIPGQCGCSIQDFTCECGETIGFEIVTPCAHCLAKTEDCHPWVMSTRCMVAKPRKDANGAVLAWPPATPKRCTPAARCDENDPTFAGEFKTPGVPPLPKHGREDDGMLALARPLGDRNGRAPGGVAWKKDNDRSDRRTLEDREELVAEHGATLFAKELNLDSRDQLLRDNEAAHERFVEELSAREEALERRERTVREKEQELPEECATAWTQVGAALADTEEAGIMAKTQSDAAAELKKRSDEGGARARRAEDDALARVAEVQSMRSVTEHLRAEAALKAAEVQNVKEEVLALRASRRQVEEELAAKSAELHAKAAETATMKDDLKASNEELASVRSAARRFEEELETLRAALRQGEARASFAAAPSVVPPPPVTAAAAPAPMRRMSTGSGLLASRYQPCRGCQGRLLCQCEAATTPSTAQSQAVPPPPARGRACWSSSAPWRWWRTSRVPPWGEQYEFIPVRLDSLNMPGLLSWARRVTGCGPRRHESPSVLYTRQY